MKDVLQRVGANAIQRPCLLDKKIDYSGNKNEGWIGEKSVKAADSRRWLSKRNSYLGKKIEYGNEMRTYIGCQQ